MQIQNFSQKTLLADNGSLADTPLSRLKGLLGKKTFVKGEGLIITHCRSIHMVFMRFAIDVVFVDKQGIVLGLVRNIKPYQFSPYFFKAYAAIELPIGIIEESQTQKGDRIVW